MMPDRYDGPSDNPDVNTAPGDDTGDDEAGDDPWEGEDDD